MKLLLLSVITLFTVAIHAETTPQCSKTAAKPAPTKKVSVQPAPARMAEITGSHIPVALDKYGRPINATLKVTILNESAIRMNGFGSVSKTLGYLPFATGR